MPNIEEIPVYYPASRGGLVQRIGPSAENSPGERELFDHTNLWIPGQNFIDGDNYSTGVTTYVTLGCSARVMPRGAECSVSYSFRRPRKWSDGLMTVRMWYGGKLTVTSENIIIQLGMKAQNQDSEGSTSDSFTVPAPTSSSIYSVYKGFEVDTGGIITVDDSKKMLKISIQRNGDNVSDTYDEEMLLIGVEALYIPKNGVGDGLPPWLMEE